MSNTTYLSLDFQRRRRYQGLTGRLLLLIAICITSFLAVRLFATMQTLSSQEAQYAIASKHFTPTRHTAELSAEDKQKLRAEIRDANSVMLQLSLPWNDLFKGIAAPHQNQVALLSITPDPTRRSIKLSGEAENLTVLLNYLRQLQKSKALNSVYLQKHQIDVRSAQRPVRFTIVANWVLSP